MKRLLALILALLLPYAALAETWCADLTLEVNEEYLAELLTSQLSDLTDVDASVLTSAAKLLNGLGMRIYAQEDASAIELLLGGRKLIDFTAHMNKEEMIITSDLMRGYGLIVPADEQAALLPAQQDVDWTQVLSSMLAAGMQSLSGVESTSTYGAFHGDAYTGGTYCETYVLNDADVAALVKSLMTDEFRYAASALLEASAMDADAVLARLDDLNTRAADENAHTYIVRLVWDDANRAVGASVTILRGAEQLATLSYGVQEDSIRIVIGMGYGELNYWYDASVTQADSTSLGGTVIQFTGAKDESYAYAAAVANEVLSMLVWQLHVSESESGLSWTYEHAASGSNAVMTEGVRSSGSLSNENDSFFSSTKLLLNSQELATLSCSLVPGSPIAPMAENLKLCDLSSDDEEQLNLLTQIVDMVAQVFSARITMLLPAELLLQLNNLLQ